MAEGALSGGTLRGCTCLKCTNKAAPTKQCTNSPQNTRNTQNLLAEKCLPQIDTDAHRLGGYGIPAIPTPPITQPNILWKSVKSVGEYYHAGAAASAAPTKQTERVSHRIRGTHRTFWQRSTSHRLHRCAQIRRVWHPAIPTPPITQPNHLWNSVGDSSQQVICGENKSTAGGVGMAGCHTLLQENPWENTTTLINKQTGRECPTEYAEHTEPSGREAPPTDCTDAHRLGGYGIPAIPTLPITQPNIP